MPVMGLPASVTAIVPPLEGMELVAATVDVPVATVPVMPRGSAGELLPPPEPEHPPNIKLKINAYTIARGTSFLNTIYS
jgi:hypothetical protein